MKKLRQLQKSDSAWLTAVAALVVLQFWWLPGDPGTPDDSYSNSIEGKRGLFQTLDVLSKADALPPVRRETGRLLPDTHDTLLLLSPDRYPNAHEQQRLAEWVYNGGSLLFAPNWGDPACSISQLNIFIQEESWFRETTTGTAAGSAGNSAPSAQTGPPAASAEQTTEQAEADVESQPVEAELPDSAAPEMPAEAVDESPVPPAVGEQKNIAETLEEGSTDEVDMQKTPSLLPPQPGEFSIQDADDTSPSASELDSSSVLVDGTVPWRTRASMTTPYGRATTLVTSMSGEVQAAAWAYGDGLVVVSASPDVFSNRALLDDAQAELAVRLVEYAHTNRGASDAERGAIVVNEFLNASDAYRGTGVLMSPGLRSGTLQLILIAVLAGWYGFHRFGPPIRTHTAERRSLTDSATAAGNLQFRSSGASESVRCYTEYLKSVLRRMFAGTVRLEDFTAVAHRTGLDPDEVRRRVTVAEELGSNSHTTATRAAGAIRDLADMQARLTGSLDAAKKSTSARSGRK